MQYEDARVYRRLAPFCTDPAAAFVAMDDIVSDPDLIRGRIDLAAIRDRLTERLGLEMSLSAFQNAWNQPYSWPTPGMLALVKELARRYRLVLLSNVDAYYWKAVCTGYEELSAFGDMLLSFELGIAKPEAEAFRLACKAAGCQPEKCFFVDDKLENVEAARAQGIHGHHFGAVTALRADLESRGLV